MPAPTRMVAGTTRVFNGLPDIPDIRDRMYEPALIPLGTALDNSRFATVRNQGREGSCTGHGLAAVIDVLNSMLGNAHLKVSPRMLYEMAKRHDEWPGDTYQGSSCRGAIKGWKNMGVCSETSWTYIDGTPGTIDADKAWEARSNGLGAYYRLRPEIADYHAALSEVGAIYVSARVHNGWVNPSGACDVPGCDLPLIQPGGSSLGGHAFAIVGYNKAGFIVQNSWGDTWGAGGFAVWSYSDWIATISDGWVFRLALPTPEIFNITAEKARGKESEFFTKSPSRGEIAGHFIHFDDGHFHTGGKYWSDLDDTLATAQRIAQSADKYDHLLIYAHGGLNSPKASARRIEMMKDGFKRNRIYPMHIMYDTGLMEELKDIVFRSAADTEGKAEGLFNWLKEQVIELSDRLIEKCARKPGTAIWDEMKRGARTPFENGADGELALRALLATAQDSDLKVHVVGHSTGAIVHGHLLDAIDRIGGTQVASASLMAPACTVDFYKKHIGNKRLRQDQMVEHIDVYNLTNELELADHVAGLYRKSLIELVSRAFERGEDVPILGIERFNHGLRGASFHYASSGSRTTNSTTHGGFDNDAATMNSIVTRVLGQNPAAPFTQDELN